MTVDGSGFPGRRKGFRIKATRKNQGNEPRTLEDRIESQPAVGHPPNEPMGMVGASVTIGMSTQYAAQKIEVCVWESVPVTGAIEDRDRAKNEVRGRIQSEAEQLLDEATAKFFPELLKGAS